jgi:hypothetical protein
MMTNDGQEVSGVLDHDLDDASRADVIPVNPTVLHTRPPFEELFPTKPEVVDRIVASMKAAGFDKAQPIHMWRQGDCVVDGHQRRLAAIRAGVLVVTYYHDFATEDEALDYAIANQRNRRNLTDDELLSVVAAVDKRMKRGGDRKSEAAKSKRENSLFDPSMSSQTDPGKSSREETAEKLGISPDKVRAVRTVLKDPEVAAEVRAGKKKLLRAASEARAKRKATKAAKGGSPTATGEAKAVPAVEVVPAGPRREANKARCIEIIDPLWAAIRRAYDDLPANHHGLFVQEVWLRAGLLKSEAESEGTRAGKAEDEPSRAGKAGQVVTLKMVTDINTKASASQIQRAYEAHFGREMTGGYSAASRELIAAMGPRAAKTFVLSQSKDPIIGP